MGSTLLTYPFEHQSYHLLMGKNPEISKYEFLKISISPGRKITLNFKPSAI